MDLPNRIGLGAVFIHHSGAQAPVRIHENALSPIPDGLQRTRERQVIPARLAKVILGAHDFDQGRTAR